MSLFSYLCRFIFRQNFMKRTVLFICLAVITSLSFAQNNDFSLRFNTRADYDYNYFEGKNNDNSGFAGKFLNIMLDGKINDKFEYHWRQRLNRTNFTSNFFEATDWAYLTYKIDNNFSLSVGKQVVAIGGFEYDYAPIDVYFYSDFCNVMPSCYEFGTSLTWNANNQALTFQISNSIFKQQPFDGLYAYNLLWNGNIAAWWKTLYSTNLIEYRAGEYVNYIALGNQFYVDNFVIDLDYINKYIDGQDNFFADFTLTTQVKYQLPQLNIFAKVSYDQNKSEYSRFISPNYWTMTVAPGTEYMLFGAGVEYFPIKNSKDVRLHAVVSSNDKAPANLFLNAGITWNMKLK